MGVHILMGALSVPIVYIVLRLIFKKSMMFKFSLYISLFVILVSLLGNFSGILDSPIFSAVATIIDLCVGLVLFSYLNKYMRIPLVHSISQLVELSNGNLNISVPKMSREDELGLLNNALLVLIKNLSSVVSEINENSKKLTDVSNQINNTSQQLSEGAGEQASSTEEVSSTIEEMQSNIENNTENSKRTSSKSLKVQQNVLEVGKKSGKVVEANVLINEKVSIIKDIAHQTNILALNAAVEAARAGEQGKGFAVVASEVRKLAVQSKEAAEEIISLSENTMNLSEEAGASLSAIIPEIEETANLVKDITDASIEQNMGAEQVNKSVQQLNYLAQQNASTSEELATTSEEMTRQAKKLKGVIEYFKL